jgi:hypothetical protein
MVWVSIWDVTLMDWYGWEAWEWGLFCYLLINEITSSQENITAFLLVGEPWQMTKSNFSCFYTECFFHLFWDRKETMVGCSPHKIWVALCPCVEHFSLWVTCVILSTQMQRHSWGLHLLQGHITSSPSFRNCPEFHKKCSGTDTSFL